MFPAPCQFKPVPIAADTYWRRTIPRLMRNDYAARAEKYMDCAWESIPDSIFAEYSVNGIRTNYEKRCFALRRQLACLVMGEVMEHNGRFIYDIVNGINYLQSETWWGIPAHYTSSIPEAENQVVDLYNAETANLLAWTVYMLHDELENKAPGICEAVRSEIDRRMLTPCRTEAFSWKRWANNWNTWICENWLSCVLLCEKDHAKRKEAIRQIMECLSLFYSRYPADGGCDEGIGYWRRAGGSFFVCAHIINRATNGRTTIFHDEKFQSILQYVYKVYIGKRACVNFADSKTYTQPDISILFPYGAIVGDSIMLGYAAQVAIDSDFNRHPAKRFALQDFPSISRELMFLSLYPLFKEVQPAEPLLRDVWLKDLQVMTARSEANTTNGLFIAAKGGHNGETHNHNDVGNFIVYDDGEPVLIDIGSGTYTAQTFGDKRYELFNCRSSFHNVPIINGVEQHAGKLFTSKSVDYHSNDSEASLNLDLSNAYPPEAHVDSWRRSITLHRRDKIVITEDYHLKKYVHPSEIVLICCGKTLIDHDGNIAITGRNKTHRIFFDTKMCSPFIEKINTNDPIIINGWQHQPLYRIRLVIRDNSLAGKVSYFIK